MWTQNEASPKSMLFAALFVGLLLTLFLTAEPLAHVPWEEGGWPFGGWKGQTEHRLLGTLAGA